MVITVIGPQERVKWSFPSYRVPLTVGGRLLKFWKQSNPERPAGDPVMRHEDQENVLLPQR